MRALRSRTSNSFVTYLLSVASTGRVGDSALYISSYGLTLGRDWSVDGVERDAGLGDGGQPHEARGDDHAQDANGKCFHRRTPSWDVTNQSRALNAMPACATGGSNTKLAVVAKVSAVRRRDRKSVV